MRRACAVAIVVVALLGMGVPAGAVEGGNAVAAKRCAGEWATLRGAHGEKFKNAGQCTSFAAKGGQFAPALQPLFMLLTYEPAFDGGSTNMTIDVSGLVGATARLHEVIGGFVLDGDVPSDSFPLIQWWACGIPGTITVTYNATGASVSAPFAPPPEACIGQV
ncbi:MAG: hypothetical protein QOG64_2362 [Acidimicrobiaceae bacterium]|nr:hypothetical protein [Acidimicrobiaceae bacterium]